VTVVELDRKGRALLPASLRKKLGTRRFEVRLVDGRIELVPLQSLKSLKGKYRSRLKTPWPELEEKAEKFVTANKR
jgi:AbrB family looped-hinge helix DNA binding protein